MNPNPVLELAFSQGQKYFDWLDSFHGPLDKPLVETIEKTCGIIWDRKGKRLRCHFVYWFSEPYKILHSELELYSWAVEAIHTATLLHDDVIDKAEIRRAGPSANQIFDNTIPVISGDYLMSDAIHQLAVKGHPDLLRGMCSALKQLTQGEILQYESQFKIPENEETYRNICKLKTASLLSWAASVGPTLSSSTEKPSVVSFAETYGLLYQFTDDILDLKGTQTKNKNQDLNEGKLNWASWKVLEGDVSARKKLEADFNRGTVTQDTVQAISESFRAPSQQRRLNSFLNEQRQECQNLLSQFGNSYLRQLLSTLVDFTLSRIF